MAGLLGKMGFARAPDPLQFARQADELRLKGSVKKAIQLCQDGLKLRPGYVTGYAILARCLVDDDRGDEARDTLTEALRHEPHNIAVLTELAGLLEEEANLPLALNYYRQALAIDPLNQRVRTRVQRLAPGDTDDQEGPPPARQTEAQRASNPINEESPDAVEVAAESAVLKEVFPVSQVTPVVMADPVETAPAPEILTVPDVPAPVVGRSEIESAPLPRASGPWIAEMFGRNFPSGDAPHPVRLSEGGVHRFYADIVTAVIGGGDSSGRVEEQSGLSPDVEGVVAVAPTLDPTPELVPVVETFAIEIPPPDIESPVVETFAIAIPPPDVESPVVETFAIEIPPPDVESPVVETFAIEIPPPDIESPVVETSAIEIPPPDIESPVAYEQGIDERAPAGTVETFDLKTEEEQPSLAIVDDVGPETEAVARDVDLVWEEAEPSEASQEVVKTPSDTRGDDLEASDKTEPSLFGEQTTRVEETENAAFAVYRDRRKDADVPEKTPSPRPEPVYLDKFFTGKGIPLPFSSKQAKPKMTVAESTFELPIGGSPGSERDTTADTELTESMARLEKGLRKQVLFERDILPVAPRERQEENLPPEEEPDTGEVIPTATLAELYVRQGLLSRAISVYLAMVARDPTNPEIHKRLAELSDKKTGQGTS